MKVVKVLSCFGMVAAVSYVAHVVLGNLLWPSYDPMRNYIASLTATGAPNAGTLRIFTIIFGVAQILFSIAMLMVAKKALNGLIQIGCTLFLIMSVVSLVGFNLFPAELSGVRISDQDAKHSAVNFIVLTVSIIAITLITLGYFSVGPKKGAYRLLGVLSFSTLICITVFGFLTVVLIAAGFPYMGLVERISIYSYQLYIFIISFFYTFIFDLNEAPYALNRAIRSPANELPDDGPL